MGMKKINLTASKKMELTRSQSIRDRVLKWVGHYANQNFGIWVECSDCKKWRRTFQYSESHEVPENWCCSSLTLENGEQGSCSDPEEDSTEHYLKYSPGSVVWAKLKGYPWWPAMVDADPDSAEYFQEGDGVLEYNVTFLDKKVTRAWIPDMHICPFSKSGEEFSQNISEAKYAAALLKAKKRAKEAMEMTIKDRLLTYSFVYSYKGRWPDKLKSEVNGSKRDKDLTDQLLNEMDDSTDSGNERIHDDFREKETNSAKKRKLISNYSDNASGDFITESEVAPTYIKKKVLKHVSSRKKTSKKTKHQTLVECTENVTHPLQEKEGKEIKKKIRKKFSLKNFQKRTYNLFDYYIDSENSKAVAVPLAMSGEAADNGKHETQRLPTILKPLKGKKLKKNVSAKKKKNVSDFRKSPSI